jgi:hypothetical protein
MPGADASDGANIPVFTSIPSKLEEDQRASRDYVYYWLARVGLEPRTVGVSDNTYFNPLHEVRTLARHCAGGLILGYWQVFAEQATTRVRDGVEGGFATKTIEKYYAPTPWNQLETGVLFGLGLPLLVLKQGGITGGIFDEGASDVFVQPMPMPGVGWRPGVSPDAVSSSFEKALFRWQALVRCHYYED